MSDQAGEQQLQQGRGSSSSSLSSASSAAAAAAVPPAVKISLKAQSVDQKEKAAISIQMNDPDAMIDKVLELLAARFPIQAFYHVLANQQEIIRAHAAAPEAREKAADVTLTVESSAPAEEEEEGHGGPSPRTFSSKVNSAMYAELVRLSEEEHSPINSLTSITMKSWLKDALSTLSASELEEVTSSVSPSNSSQLAKALIKRAAVHPPPNQGITEIDDSGKVHQVAPPPLIMGTRQSTASIIEGVNYPPPPADLAKPTIGVRREDSTEGGEEPAGEEDESAGKWETVDESLLLADRETEHSNGAASLGSSHFSSNVSEGGHHSTALSLWPTAIVNSVVNMNTTELSNLINGVHEDPELVQLVQQDDKFSAWVENLLSIRKKITSVKPVTRTKMNLTLQPTVGGIRLTSVSDTAESTSRVPDTVPIGVPLKGLETQDIMHGGLTQAAVVRGHAPGGGDDGSSSHHASSHHSNSRPESVHESVSGDGASVDEGHGSTHGSTHGSMHAIHNGSTRHESFDWAVYSDLDSRQKHIVEVSGGATTYVMTIPSQVLSATGCDWLTILERAMEAERGEIDRVCRHTISSVLTKVRVPHSGVGNIDSRIATGFVHQHPAVCRRIVTSVKHEIFQTIRELCAGLNFESTTQWPELESVPLMSAEEEAAFFGPHVAVGRFLAESSVRMAIHGCAEYLTNVQTLRPCTAELETVMRIPFQEPSRQKAADLVSVVEAHRRDALNASLNAAIESYQWEVLSGKELLAFVESFYLNRVRADHVDESIKEITSEASSSKNVVVTSRERVTEYSTSVGVRKVSADSSVRSHTAVVPGSAMRAMLARPAAAAPTVQSKEAMPHPVSVTAPPHPAPHRVAAYPSPVASTSSSRENLSYMPKGSSSSPSYTTVGRQGVARVMPVSRLPSLMQGPVVSSQAVVYSPMVSSPMSATNAATRMKLSVRQDEMKTTPAACSPPKPSFSVRAGSPLAALGAKANDTFLGQLHKLQSAPPPCQ